MKQISKEKNSENNNNNYNNCFIYNPNSIYNEKKVNLADNQNKLSIGIKKKKKSTIKTIGLNRYNFFLTGQTIDYLNKLKGKKTNYSRIKIKLFPVHKLNDNFRNYINKLKYAQNTYKLKIIDSQLIEIINKFTNLATNDEIKDRELIRFFGLICDYAFIGPEQIVIDPFHRCNTNCIHCWNHAPTIDPPDAWKNEKLKLSDFKKLINNASNLKVDLMVFGGAGEPLLHPEIIDIFKMASEKNIQIIVSTNAINLTKKVTDKLMQCNIKELICSLPAATIQTYGTVNPMHNNINTFSKIIRNLKYFVHEKKFLKKECKLSMYHVIHNQNYHEISKMANMDLNIGVDLIRFSLIRLQKEFNYLKLTHSQIKSIKKSIDFLTKYLNDKPIELKNNIHFQLDNIQVQSGKWSGKILKKWGCKIGYFFSLLLASGQLSLCCHVREIGNINKTAFTDLWTSDYYNQNRYKAKYIKNFKNTIFKNGIKLYDDKCENCDNHVTLIKIEEKINEYGLQKFFKY